MSFLADWRHTCWKNQSPSPLYYLLMVVEQRHLRLKANKKFLFYELSVVLPQKTICSQVFSAVERASIIHDAFSFAKAGLLPIDTVSCCFLFNIQSSLHRRLTFWRTMKPGWRLDAVRNGERPNFCKTEFYYDVSFYATAWISIQINVNHKPHQFCRPTLSKQVSFF